MVCAYVIFVISAILGLALYYLKQCYSYWQRHNVPFVEPNIPFGSLASIKPDEHFSLLLTNYYNERKHEGPMVGVHFFFKPALLITDLDLVRQMLIKDFQYFQDRAVFYNEKHDPLSAHLFNIDHAKWKPLRSKLTPTFTSGKMKYMFPTIVSVANEFVDVLTDAIRTDSEVEINDWLGRFTTDIIGTCAFGIECNSLKDPQAKFRQMGKKVFDKPKNSATHRFLITFCKRLARALGVRTHHKDVTDFFLNIVKETVEYREKNNVQRNDFMNLLIELKNSPNEAERLTINEIAAQAYVFFLGGFETSSTTLTYCLYELALEQNKHIQDEARREIKKVLQNHNGELTYDALNEMTFCEQIINETLRKHPPAGALSRLATKDYKIPNSHYTIPKGMMVLTPVYAFHHDPDIYEKPEEFNPHRFAPDEVNNRHSCALLSFGDGPRNCIASRFGKIQARIGLVKLLQNFEFSSCSRTPIPMKYHPKKHVLSPLNRVWLNIKMAS